jgi:hypothetical protein
MAEKIGMTIKWVIAPQRPIAAGNAGINPLVAAAPERPRQLSRRCHPQPLSLPVGTKTDVVPRLRRHAEKKRMSLRCNSPVRCDCRISQNRHCSRPHRLRFFIAPGRPSRQDPDRLSLQSQLHYPSVCILRPSGMHRWQKSRGGSRLKINSSIVPLYHPCRNRATKLQHRLTQRSCDARLRIVYPRSLDHLALCNRQHHSRIENGWMPLRRRFHLGQCRLVDIGRSCCRRTHSTLRLTLAASFESGSIY